MSLNWALVVLAVALVGAVGGALAWLRWGRRRGGVLGVPYVAVDDRVDALLAAARDGLAALAPGACLAVRASYVRMRPVLARMATELSSEVCEPGRFRDTLLFGLLASLSVFEDAETQLTPTFDQVRAAVDKAAGIVAEAACRDGKLVPDLALDLADRVFFSVCGPMPSGLPTAGSMAEARALAAKFKQQPIKTPKTKPAAKPLKKPNAKPVAKPKANRKTGTPRTPVPSTLTPSTLSTWSPYPTGM